MRSEEGPLGRVIFDGPNDEWRLRLDIPMADLDCHGGPLAALCGVNPSTADAFEADQTIRKDMGFARVHRWGRIAKCNLFGWRAKDVRELARADDPIGAANDEVLLELFQEADIIVGCWGPAAKVPPKLRGRWREIAQMAEYLGKPIHCFGTAKDGQPLHTLTLAYSTPLIEWRAS